MARTVQLSLLFLATLICTLSPGEGEPRGRMRGASMVRNATESDEVGSKENGIGGQRNGRLCE